MILILLDTIQPFTYQNDDSYVVPARKPCYGSSTECRGGQLEAGVAGSDDAKPSPRNFPCNDSKAFQCLIEKMKQ